MNRPTARSTALTLLACLCATALSWHPTTARAKDGAGLDRLRLGGDPLPELLDRAGQPTLRIDVTRDRHPISPQIYGMNNPDPALAAELALPISRWGGNDTSRYNWRNNTSNTGKDWFFQNIPKTADRSLDAFVNANRARGTASVVTVPMTGWVARDSPAQHPYLCSYPRSEFPEQDAFDTFDPDCGNGLRDGKPLTGADPDRTSIPAGPGFVRDMVAAQVAEHGLAARGGVGYYGLDNEPMLWHETHRDVHPQRLSFAELARRSIETATAIKDVDPTAKVLGPSDWGWCAYFFSAVDRCGQTPTDRDRYGMDLAPWYLRQFHAHADANGGRRLLDYFDEHYYPQARGVALQPAGDAATQALRLRSTRSLWDPGYVDESWIGKDVKAPPIQLVRRMRGWVAAEYPGTRIAISEYNFGGLESVNGALAQAEVLGIFARERVHLATLWEPPSLGQPGAYAFRIFRDYDGAGSTFGDVSARADSRAVDRLSVFAATRADGALTVIVINKTGRTITAGTRLTGFQAVGPAQRFEYGQADPTRIVRRPTLPVDVNGWTTDYPANSITLLVLS